MARFVLVHGCWQNGSAWSAVASHLRVAGHLVLTPDLLGCAPGTTDRSGITLTGMVRVLRDELNGADDLVLVGHSGAGPVVQALTALMPAQIRQVIFVNAGVLLPGECLLDVMPAEYAGLGTVGRARPDQSVPMEETTWDQVFLGTRDGMPLGAWWREVFQPLACPVGWLTDRPAVAEFWRQHQTGAVPASYVHLVDDVTAPGSYLRMRLRLHQPRVVITAGPHEAMLTHPSELAAALLDAADLLE